MKTGDKIKAFVQIGLMKKPDWLRGTLVGEGVVEVNGNRLTLDSDKIRLWQPLDHDSDGCPAVRDFADRTWEDLKRYVTEGASHFLPGEKVTIDEKEKTITVNDVTVYPDYTEVKTIVSFREMPCWTVSYWEDSRPSYMQPPDVDEVICGNSMNTLGAARILIDNILKNRADSYWDAVSEDEMARSFTEEM